MWGVLKLPKIIIRLPMCMGSVTIGVGQVCSRLMVVPMICTAPASGLALDALAMWLKAKWQNIVAWHVVDGLHTMTLSEAAAS